MSQHHRVHGSRSTRTLILGAVTTAALLVSLGCQDPMKLPVRKVGTRCSPVGAQARSATHLLECKKNKKWTKTKTLGEAQTDYSAFLASQTTVPAPDPTTTAAPTPAPAPAPTPTLAPITQTSLPQPPVKGPFGLVSNFPVGRGANQIDPGLYLATAQANGGCTIKRFSPTGAQLGTGLGWEGPIFFLIPDEPATVTTSGDCLWAPAPTAAQPIPASGDGGYRVGTEIAPGRYTAPGNDVDKCFWLTLKSADFAPSSATDVSYSTGPQMVVIEPTDTIFSSNGCGPWTPLPVLPDRYFSLDGQDSNSLTQGHRAFYSGPALTFTSSLTPLGEGFSDTVTAVGGSWQLTLKSPTGALLTDDTYDFASPQTATKPNLSLTGDGRTCSSPTGVFVVSGLHRSLDNTIDGGDIDFAFKCANTGVAFGKVHIAPPRP